MNGRMIDIEALVPRILPQVLPCPRSMVIDAIQAVAVDFCKVTEVWVETVTEPVGRMEQHLEIGLPRGVEIVRARELWLDGGRIEGGFYASGRTIILGAPVPHDCEVTVAAVLRPSRLATHVPDSLIEEWGDVLAYGALAKLKAMSGRNVEWADPQGAAIALQQYNEGSARARVRAVRARNGGGSLYAVGHQETV